MSSQVATVAAAVVTALNAGTFVSAFTAERKYLPAVTLETLADALKVYVVPRTRVLERASRAVVEKDLRVDVAIMKRFGTTDPTDIDPLMELSEQIADFFVPGALSGTDAFFVRAEQDPIIDYEKLATDRVFMGVVSLTFRVP